MADVRCPMCGKPNPAERDVCQYCQARLKPLVAGEQGAKPPSGGESPLPDWLSSLRDPGPEDEPSPAAPKRESVPDWLSSLRAGADDEEEKPAETPKSEDSTSWLDSILSEAVEPEDDLGDVAPAASHGAYPSEDVDWLSRIGGEETPPLAATPDWQPPAKEEPLAQDAASAGDPFAWLRSGEEELPPAEAPEAEAGALPDWLSGLQPETDQAAPEQSQAAPEHTPPAAGDAGDSLAWLRSLDEEQPIGEAPAQPEAPGLASEDELPDWLSGLQPAAVPPAAQEAASDDPFAWLRSSDEDAQDDDSLAQAAADMAADTVRHTGDPQAWMLPSADELPAEAPAPGEIPDWLSGLQSEPVAGDPGTEPEGSAELFAWLRSTEEEPLAGADLPDWLLADAEPSGETAPGAAPEGAAQLPAVPGPAEAFDWLTPAEETPAAEQPAGLDKGLPGWLAAAAAAGTIAAAGADERSEETPAADILDWLRPAADSEAAAEAPSEPLADWLSSLYQPPGQTSEPDAANLPTDFIDWLAPAPQAGAETPAADDLDWLRAEAEPSEGVLAEEAGELPPGQIPDWLSGVLGELEDEAPAAEAKSSHEMPGWMAELTENVPGLSTTPESPFPAELESDLSWLEEDAAALMAARAARPEDEEPSEPLPDKALPAWVGQQEDDEAAAPPAEGDLRPADLPAWLKAMRPVGAVGAAAFAAEQVEGVTGAGPLAGLRGVLPAEPDVTQTAKPPTYSSRLNVSELHRSHADLLSSLTESEGISPPLPEKPAITSTGVLRLALAFLIILPVLLSLYTGFPQLGQPSLLPEVDAAVAQVAGLPPGAPVLLALDYQPGYTGEMDTLTGAVVEHLSRQGAYISVVSTVPTGPLQAQRLFNTLQQQRGLPLTAPQSYVNLGLIPNGAAGLQAFAAAPRTVLPYDIGSAPGWEQAPLQSVNSLKDFRMILVAVDDPETARVWIEQVQAASAGVPMLVLASAQVDPVVRPYLETGQVQGMAGGLMGAAAYEQAIQQSYTAARYWPPFSVGMLVGALLMFLAILYNLASQRLAAGQKDTRAARPAQSPPAAGEVKP